MIAACNSVMYDVQSDNIRYNRPSSRIEQTKYSILKTTSSPLRCHSMRDGDETHQYHHLNYLMENMEGGGEGYSLALTPSWAVAIVITIMVIFGFLFSASLDHFGEVLQIHNLVFSTT